MMRVYGNVILWFVGDKVYQNTFAQEIGMWEMYEFWGDPEEID